MVDVHVKGAADKLKKRAERDTGAFCREILGFNYDIDEKTGERFNEGKGGIYKTGPHQKIVKVLDSKTKRKQIMCPRKARKTSLLTGYMCRNIVTRPNIRIKYAMRIKTLAKKTVRVVRHALEHNEKINELWGEQRSKDLPWADEGFIVATRTDFAERNYTLSPWSLEVGAAGDRGDIIILDDLVDWQNVMNPEQIDKQITFYKLCIPLLEHGGTLIDVGTPYDESDVHHFIRDEHGDAFESLWIPTGMEMVYDGKSKPTLEGVPIWPHFTARFLEGELDAMGPRDFMANMNMECQSADEQLFKREMFRPAAYEPDWMRFLSGYLVTDSAVSEDARASRSVLALILIDAADNLYLADLRVGLWKPDAFVTEFMTMCNAWRSRCRLVAQLFENVMLSQVYQSMIEEKARQMQMPINLIGVPVGTDPKRKERLRRSLQPHLASGSFYVLDTVDPSVEIRGKWHTLWDPQGHVTKDGNQLPAGMLVDSFIRPALKKKDITDAIALAVQVDSSGRRFCPPSAQTFRGSRNRDTLPQNGSYWSQLPAGRKRGWGDMASRANRRRR